MERESNSAFQDKQPTKRELLLEKELERQKKARKEAERILEEKYLEHYNLTQQLKETNAKLEGLLMEKTSELEGVFLNILDAYMVIDLYGNVIKMNNAAIDLFGVKGRSNINLLELVHEDYFQETKKSFKKLQTLGALPNLTFTIQTRNNEEKLLSVNASIIYDRYRNPIAAQGIVKDITKENQIKELLATQRRELDVIVNKSPIAIALTKGKTLVKINQAFEDLTGYGLHELKHLDSYRILSHKEDMPLLIHKMKQLQKGVVDSFSMIKRFMRRDGSWLWGRLTVSVVRNRKGEIEFEIVLAQDISDEIRSQRKIEEQQKQLKIIVENSPLGVVLLIDDAIIKANKTFQGMTGYAEKELIGNNITSFIGNWAKSSDDEIEEDKTEYVVEFTRKNGEEVIGRTVVSDVRSNEGFILYQVIIIEDITDEIALKEQERMLIGQLESSNQSLKEYAHVVSHDLKSPLRSISALATWMYEDYKDVLDDNGKYNLTMMQEKIESMDKLIGGILNYSSINKESLKKQKVNLNRLIKEIKGVIYIPAHVIVKVVKPLPKIYGDETRFRQLFQNIISNAVVHIEKDPGLVLIDYESTKTHWQFSIQDNGVGIAPEYHKKIFKIFESVGNKEQSTGIGLSIVKKIVEIYKGEIWLESKRHKGTTFYFTIRKLEQKPK
ncbi:MAG: PAS domain S-box protein [Flavobacteriaceae bacterium]|nr:PAS domain S-box protein [Flavobacteriaceae bacterium]